MSRTTGILGVLFAAILVGQSGCAVPQKPGRGKQMHLVEPSTHTSYWLYLPEDYVARDGRHPQGGRWPMVVTLHGLRPYDNAAWQNREWQEEADRYGLIVVAPDLRTCDSLTMQLPLRDPHLSYVRKDEKGILAVMSEVFRRTNADPQRVLMTSFSSGGYLAHYLVNRHPNRFTALAVRGSNFNRQLLETSQVPRYRNMPIGIFFGQNDIAICRHENMEAIEWYRAHRFNVVARMVKGLGHERRPQFAAAMFARAMGLTPKTPPDLGSVVMLDIPPSGRPTEIARRPIPPRKPPPLIPSGPKYPPASGIRSAEKKPADVLFADRERKERARQTSRRPIQVRPAGSIYRPVSPDRTPPRRTATPKRPALQPYSTPVPPAPRTRERPLPTRIPTRERADEPPIAARIQLVDLDETANPVRITLRIELSPPALQQGASVLWTDNGVPVGSNGLQVRTWLRQPGKHTLTAHVMTADDRTLTASYTLDVPVPSTQPADS